MDLYTKRLNITRFSPEMAEAVHLNSLDEDVRRFVPDEVFPTVEDALETVEFLISCYESGEGPLVYPVLITETGENIGYVQAVPLDEGRWEVGYHIAKAYTNNGYATEAVTAFLPEIMERISIDSILGICVAENIASRKVLEKCGFALEFEGNGLYHDEMRPVCRYRFTK